jgi:hypothetical protein
MKIKNIVLTLLSLSIVGAAAGQESDDMYFTAKDRARLRDAKQTEQSMVIARNDKQQTRNEKADVNPTDSYSARNVNPEFTSRSVAETAQQDNEDYFVSDYGLRNRNELNNFNNSFNNWYNSPWYTTSYWGAGYNRWNSWNNPYYGGAYGNYYDAWGSPFRNPYYRSGWSTSFSYSYGNAWGNSWGSGWGMNSGFGCPYSYWGPSYSSFYSPYYGGGYYGYGPTVVVVERDRGYVYGKRSSRSNYLMENNNTPNTGRSISSRTGDRGDNNGRIRTNNSRQADYYEHTMRNGSRQTATPSGSTSSGRVSTWDNNNSNSDGNSRSTYRSNTNSSPSYNPPTRSTDSGSGSRSSGSNSSSGSGSRTSRGRGN